MNLYLISLDRLFIDIHLYLLYLCFLSLSFIFLSFFSPLYPFFDCTTWLPYEILICSSSLVRGLPCLFAFMFVLSSIGVAVMFSNKPSCAPPTSSLTPHLSWGALRSQITPNLQPSSIHTHYHSVFYHYHFLLLYLFTLSLALSSCLFCSLAVSLSLVLCVFVWVCVCVCTRVCCECVWGMCDRERECVSV